MLSYILALQYALGNSNLSAGHLFDEMKSATILPENYWQIWNSDRQFTVFIQISIACTLSSLIHSRRSRMRNCALLIDTFNQGTGMSLNTHQEVAIVTGASRGIGAEIAKQLGRDGYAVVVNYAGSAAEAQAVVAAIVAAQGQAIAVQADVADAAAVEAMFEQAISSFGRVDVLINNAGIMPAQLPLLADTDDATFDRLIAVNLKGSFNTMRAAAHRLQQGGRIVNFSTSVIGLALPGYSVYAATKAAIETMTNIFAKELRGKQITVNAIAPGPTSTALFLDGKTPELIERMSRMAPLERLGSPEDIARAVAFLAAPGNWVNGQTLRANGGLV
jgi:3-oxoacyl-[acyl-carrier protein] reductase